MNVFITGASSGIGEELAKEFASRGATLGLVARRREALESLAAALPGTHHVYAVDVTDKDALIAAGRAFEQAAGGVDIVIANAGISVGVKTEHYEDLAQFEKVLATNVLAMAYTFHPFIARMKSVRRGTLVGIASVAGIRGLPGSDAYCASKSAAITYLESLRVEMAKHHVKVVTISPGFIRTPLTAKNPYRHAVPDGRRGLRPARGRRDRRRRALPDHSLADGRRHGPVAPRCRAGCSIALVANRRAEAARRRA